jgi:hypothetical protein
MSWPRKDDFTQEQESTIMPTYKIVRKYADSTHPDHNKRIASGLTLEEAQKHCCDPTTSEKGVWFDCYYEEGRLPKRPSMLDQLCMLQTKNPARYLGC